MKKALKPIYQPLSLFFISMITAGLFFASCNNNGDDKKQDDDSTKPTISEAKSAEPMSETSGGGSAEAIVTGTKADTTVEGTVKFTQTGMVVKMELSLSVPKMANHSVAVHIHEHGDCGDAGKMTHGHWNPTNKQHGKWGSGEYHSGDIGNISLDAQGKGTFTLETNLWSIGGDAQKDILDKAIIVHSGVDDYTSQPAGNAGSRIGCGKIIKK